MNRYYFIDMLFFICYLFDKLMNYYFFCFLFYEDYFIRFGVKKLDMKFLSVCILEVNIYVR